MNNLNYLDIILGLPLIWGIYSGFRKGIIIEIGSFIALVAGAYGALKFSDIAGDFLSKKLNFVSSYLHLISFVLVFVVVVIAVFLLAKMAETMFKIAALGWLNRLIGAIFGLAKFAFLVSMVLLTIQNTGILTKVNNPQPIQSSYLFNPLQKFAPALITAFPKGEATHLIRILRQDVSKIENFN